MTAKGSDSFAYQCGRRAYLDGLDFDDNPYMKSWDKARRKDWYVGWLDARTAKKFGHLFTKDTTP